MDDKFWARLEDAVATSPRCPGVQISCAVAQGDLPEFVRRVASMVEEKEPSSFSISWDGTVVLVKFGFE